MLAEMTPETSEPFDRAPLFVKLLCTLSGLVIMGVGAGLLPVDPSHVHAPLWVIFLAGLVFFLAGMLLFLAQLRFTHPALYLFLAAFLVSLFAVIGFWIAMYSKGPFTGTLSTPLFVHRSGTESGIFPRLLFGFGAVITTLVAVVAWVRWWRALMAK
jgi:hypothetical protein